MGGGVERGRESGVSGWTLAYRLRQVDPSFSIYETGGDAYFTGECSSISIFGDGSQGPSVGALTLLQCFWAPVRVTKVQATLRFS